MATSKFTSGFPKTSFTRSGSRSDLAKRTTEQNMFSFINNSLIPKGYTFQIKQDVPSHSKSKKQYSFQIDESGICLHFTAWGLNENNILAFSPLCLFITVILPIH